MGARKGCNDGNGEIPRVHFGRGAASVAHGFENLRATFRGKVREVVD